MPAVLKQGSNWYDQLSWFHQLRDENRPSGLKQYGSIGYTYELVDGRHPQSWTTIRKTIRDVLWEAPGLPKLPIDRNAYAEYVKSRAPKQYSEAIYEMILDPGLKFTPVAICHGDLTYGNMIVTPKNKLVFIDPGHHRRLPCRELDEAKLMQSQNGWDLVRRGHTFPGTDDYPCNRERLVLYATHLMRLLRHRHPESAIAWAKSQLEGTMSTLGVTTHA